MFSDPRIVIQRLCTERGEDFASLSRMLGRNSAYIQQFVRRGVPKRLGETERRKLARYFAISEALLGGPVEKDVGNDLVAIVRSAVRASAGYGAFPQESDGKAYFGFDERWLKSITASRQDQLSIVRVEGDSMAPTLNAGDDILIDSGDGVTRLRDGIYVIRAEDILVVKRVAVHPLGRTVTLQSDNPAYPDWPDFDVDSIQFIGRVIWAGRRII